MNRTRKTWLLAVAGVLLLGLVILPLLTLRVTLELPGEKPRVLVDSGR